MSDAHGPPGSFAAAAGLVVLSLRDGAEWRFRWWTAEGAPAVGEGRTRVDAGLEAELEASLDRAAEAMACLPGAEASALDGLGRLLATRLLPPSLREALAALPPEAPVLWQSDESDPPWELCAWDGVPLGLLRPVLRALPSDRASPATPVPTQGRLRALLIANPTGDLDAADEEGRALLDRLDAAALARRPRVELVARAQASRLRILELLGSGGWDLVHVSGHGRPGALLLADGPLEAAELGAALRGRPLVMLNACRSGRRAGAPGGEPGTGLISALLGGGARAVVALRFPVIDESAALASRRLYEVLLRGGSLGEAAWAARRALRARRPADPAWASLLVYGAPDLRLLPPAAERRAASVLAARLGRDAREGDGEGDGAEVGAEGGGLEAAARLVEARGGTLLSASGDRLLAAFGLPRTIEDDASRALDAGLALLEALPGAAAGVDSGPLSVRPAEAGGTPVAQGAPIDEARALAAAAAPGVLLASRASLRLASLGFEGRPDASRGLRVARTAVTGAEERRPLVGRKDELAAIERRWRAATEGRGAVLLLRGEAGIGKSHLLAEARSRFGAGARCLEIQPARAGRAPYAALGALLSSLLALPPRGAPDGRRRAAIRDALEALGARRADVLPRDPAPLEEILGLDGTREDALEESLEGPLVGIARAALADAARRGPVWLLLEDAQDLDEASLGALARIAEGVERMPILVTALCRPRWRSPWDDRPATESLALGPLPTEDCRALARGRLGPEGEALPGAWLDGIAARTGGNPLFLAETLRALSESGDLRWQADGGWRARDEGAAALPDSVQRLLQARFDRLPPEARRALDGAAVLGPIVSPEVLRAMLGAESVAAPLADLEARGFLVARWEEADYEFRHATIREAALAALAEPRTRSLHLRAARALEGRWAEPAGSGGRGRSARRLDLERAARLALHWEAAVSRGDGSGGALPSRDPEDAPRVARAARAHALAARLALRRHAPARALEHLDRAEALAAVAPAGAPAPEELLSLRGHALQRRGAFPEAIRAYESAFPRLAEQQDERLRAASLARELARLEGWQARYEAAEGWLRRGLALLEAEAAARPARSRAADAAAASLHMQAATLAYYRGRYEDALTAIDRGMAPAERGGSGRAAAAGWNLRGAVLDARGARAEAVAAYEQSLARWEALGDEDQVARVRDNLGVAAFHAGDWARAESAHRAALAWFQAVGDRDQEIYAELNLANVLLARGERREAEQVVAHARARAEAVGNVRMLAQAEANLALCALEAGDAAAAAPALRRARARIEEASLQDLAVELRLLEGRAALQEGRPRQAEAAASEALSAAQDLGLALEAALALRLRGEARTAAGAAAKGLSDLRASVEDLQAGAHPYEAARSRAALAGALRAAGRPDEARAEADRAASELRGLGAPAPDSTTLPRIQQEQRR